MRGRSVHGCRVALAAAAGALVLLAAACAPPPTGYVPAPTDAVTRGTGGVEGDAPARGASTSADGVWTTFSSAATNLVPGDDNGLDDVFLRNNTTGAVTRIALGTVDTPTISRDGRFVGFKQPTPAYEQTFGVHDRVAGDSTTWVDSPLLSVPAVTDGGTFAVTGAAGSFGLYPTYCRVRNLQTGVSTDCPPGSDGFGSLAMVGISDNARHVMYHWNDQSGGGTSGYFLYDVVDDEVTSLTGTFMGIGISNVVSDDGSKIVGAAWGSNLPMMLHDVAAGTSEPLVTMAGDDLAMPLGFSPDGRHLGFVTDSPDLDPDDTNDTVDVFRVDLTDRGMDRVSLAFGTGAQLEHGAAMCGRLVGQVLTGGRVCVFGLDEISPTDSNGVTDAFLTA